MENDERTDKSRQTLHEQERLRLQALLGEVTDGGVIENSQPIGANSVPGLSSRPCMDIGLAVWPFPLPSDRLQALADAGYEIATERDSEQEAWEEQRWRKAEGDFQLFLFTAGSERWTDCLLLRDYLRQNLSARREYSEFKRGWPTPAHSQEGEYRAAKARQFTEMLPGARSWWIQHQGFGPVETLQKELEALPCAWRISSGWAADLFLGKVTRVHHDIDVVVAMSDQLLLQEYMTARGWKWISPYEERMEAWPPRMRLELPRFQAHAHRDRAFIDFLLSDIQDDCWRFRRDPSILRTVERMDLRTETGIPFLAPELVLLFKSRRDKETGAISRKKDEEDFAKVHPHLEPERRAWLLWALTTIDPAHPWIEALTQH